MVPGRHGCVNLDSSLNLSGSQVLSRKSESRKVVNTGAIKKEMRWYGTFKSTLVKSQVLAGAFAATEAP